MVKPYDVIKCQHLQKLCINTLALPIQQVTKSFFSVSYMYLNLFKDRFWSRDLSLSTGCHASSTRYRNLLKALLIINKEKQLLERVFTDRELNVSIGRKLITTPLDGNNNIVKTDNLACVTEMVLSLDKLYNTDNLEG